MKRKFLAMVGPPESATRKPLSIVVAANPKWGFGILGSDFLGFSSLRGADF